MLEDICGPRHHPGIKLIVFLADVVVHMRQKLRAIALPRLNREATPQIIEAGHVTVGEEADVLILTPLAM